MFFHFLHRAMGLVRDVDADLDGLLNGLDTFVAFLLSDRKLMLDYLNLSSHILITYSSYFCTIP
jgi:hypothetical protein